jgi:uncharacterized protein (TIGR03067 family)
MHRPAALLCLVVVLTAAAAPVPKALKRPVPDPERFVGGWDVLRTELDGQPLTTHATVWAIDADLNMKSHHPSGQVLTWALRLDPSRSPKQIDVGSYKGIYEFDGDEVRIAYTLGGDRPATFDAKPDVYVETLRRAAEKGK